MFTPLLHDFIEFSIIKNKKEFRKYLLLLIYIYIERERERERDWFKEKKYKKKFVGKSLISSRERERERERERDWFKEKKYKKKFVVKSLISSSYHI